MDNSAFNYAVGRIRALETKLLSPGDVERMLSAKDADDAYRIFSDFDFGGSLGEAKKTEDFQLVINSELAETKKLLTKIVHFNLVWVLEILWVRYDFHNLKTALKGKFMGWDREKTLEMMLDLGSVPAEVMLDFGKNDIIPNEMRHRFIVAKEIAENIYAKTQDLRQVEYALDKDLHDLKLALAKKARNQFLLEFVQKEIDLFNLVSYFRIKEVHDGMKFEEVHTEGGTLNAGFFALEEDKFMEKLRRSDYARIALAYDIFKKEGGDFAAIEREGDDLLLSHMQKSKHTPFGPEPIFAYYWAKKNNARVVRMIMVGKLAGLPQEKIRRRLRKLYSE